MIGAGPFDPAPIDPDGIRAVACRLVETKTVCDPPEPPPAPSPVEPAASGGLLELILQLVLIAGVVLLVIIIVRVVMGLPPLKRRPKAVDDTDDLIDDDQLIGTVIIDRSREPFDWRAEAEQHRNAGHYRDALRCRYRALVGELARRGLLDEIPGRTTGEERRQIGHSSPAVVPSFTSAADLFDDAWFGHIDVNAADDDRFQTYDQEVLALAVAMPHRVPRRYQSELV